MDKDYIILTINPGSTSTKIGVFKNEQSIFDCTLSHSTKNLEEFEKIWDQYNFRKEEIINTLQENGILMSSLDVVVGRGGMIKPIPSGTYIINEGMINDARIGKQGYHASNLGCVIAYSIGWDYNIPSYIVDPPAVDDMEPLAKISGFKGIERSSIFHALNVFAIARNFAKNQNKSLKDLNIIIAHMGGGITVTAMHKGKAINVNNALDEGPFTPERTGSLPLMSFLKIVESGEYSPTQLRKLVSGKGGLTSYFNTNKAQDIENRVKDGSDVSEEIKLVFESMAYQISEEIGRRATNLKGVVDAILLTGGAAHSEMLTKWIIDRVKFIAPVFKYPGELELEALALGGLRVMRGEDKAKYYMED